MRVDGYSLYDDAEIEAQLTMISFFDQVMIDPHVLTQKQVEAFRTMMNTIGANTRTPSEDSKP